jgi:hypothetical protein
MKVAINVLTPPIAVGSAFSTHPMPTLIHLTFHRFKDRPSKIGVADG